MEDKNQSREAFASNFGFLMSAIGSAVGLGNLWGFPYKMGIGGGFAYLLIYLVLVITVGYPLIVGELALGRKSRKGAIEAYRQADARFISAGYFACLAPFLLICFYSTFGGYVLKYLIANIGDLFNLPFGVGGADSTSYFQSFISSGFAPILLGWIFLGLTVWIVIRGIESGIEKFSTFAMPALFVMLVIIVIRSCTLPGAGAGLAFIFKPDFSVFQNGGWLNALALAGSQMFFSLSLASGAIIAFASYMDKEADLEKNAIIIPLADTICALLAAMAVMPAVFAYGLEPGGGPGLLFVTLQTVFTNMGRSGALFGTIFYLLVTFAALTSSIAMMEGGVSCLLDAQQRKGKKPNRKTMTLIMGLIAFAGCTLVSYDALGSSGLPVPFGLETWLDFFDLFAEGIFMPLSGLIMAIMLGWFQKDYVSKEVHIGSDFKSETFYTFCIRYISPIFLLFILVIQLNSFFHFF